MFIARPKAGGASDTPLAARFTDDGFKLAAATGNWGDDDHLGGNKVFTVRPDVEGAAPTRSEVSETPLAASITN